MMKAYDRVEWDYLEAIMVKLGFAQQWISVVMGMVKSVSFSVLFNGEKLEGFKPTRGIRQGDPISPYLFLLAAEGLSCLLKHNQSLHLEGIKLLLKWLGLVLQSLSSWRCSLWHAGIFG
jgi:hypothetical protein